MGYRKINLGAIRDKKWRKFILVIREYHRRKKSIWRFIAAKNGKQNILNFCRRKQSSKIVYDKDIKIWRHGKNCYLKNNLE